jgi:hypothetical protein
MSGASDLFVAIDQDAKPALQVRALDPVGRLLDIVDLCPAQVGQGRAAGYLENGEMAHALEHVMREACKIGRLAYHPLHHSERSRRIVLYDRIEELPYGGVIWQAESRLDLSDVQLSFRKGEDLVEEGSRIAQAPARFSSDRA